MQAFTGNRIIRINLSGQTGPAWRKPSGMQKHSCQAEYPKISEVRPSSAMDRACLIYKQNEDKAAPRAGADSWPPRKQSWQGSPRSPSSFSPSCCSYPSLFLCLPFSSLPLSLHLLPSILLSHRHMGQKQKPHTTCLPPFKEWGPHPTPPVCISSSPRSSLYHSAP